MATAPLNTVAMRWARSPFYFNSAATLIRIGRERAMTLAELLQGIERCPDSSIFQHMFQTLREHHFIREGFSNDFAHWAFASCNEVTLAERMAGIDIREYTSVQALRERLVSVMREYLQENPRVAERQGFEPFYFCASDTVVIPTPFVARNLEEFGAGLRKCSIHSIHYHFIDARLRLKLNTNDFSLWLENEMDLPNLAERLTRIDIYTATLNDIRRSILRMVEAAAA